MRLGVVPTAATYGAMPLSDELKADVSVCLKTRSEAAWTVRRIPALRDGAVTSAAMGTPFNVFGNFKKAVTSPVSRQDGH